MKHYHHLTRDQRIKIEILKKKKFSVLEIAEEIDVHVSTVYRELKRGMYFRKHHKTSRKKIVAYSADIAQTKYQYNLKNKGKLSKIKSDTRFKQFIEDRILKGLSPEATLLEVKRNNYNFKTSICVRSLYNYIDKDYFDHISNKHLLIKSKRKRVYRKLERRPYIRKESGTNISLRPDSIQNRIEFGHWEIDTVIGKKTEPTTLLVLTERKTRYEIIFKLENKSADCVNRKIAYLKRRYADRYEKIFKTLTCDNGSEFRRLHNIHKQTYFCHPYSSWERGSNENNNRFIRRFLPKGASLANITHNKINSIETFMNNYPRKIFNGLSSKFLFEQELLNL